MAEPEAPPETLKQEESIPPDHPVDAPAHDESAPEDPVDQSVSDPQVPVPEVHEPAAATAAAPAEEVEEVSQPSIITHAPNDEATDAAEASSQVPEHVEQTEKPHQLEQPQPSTPRTPITPRPRTDSNSTVGTTATQKTSTRSSLVFVYTALQTIADSKDARKNKKLGDATQAAMAAIKEAGDPSRMNPEILFEPLQLATEANTAAVVIAALDCIGKLISYSYFSQPAELSDHPDAPPLIERAIDTLCDCFHGEATHVDVQLQIVKSLLAAILNDKIVVHGAGLLKAVRLTYNIFLLSKSSANQQVAQGALTQMIGTVFERVKTRLALKEARLNPSQVSLVKEDSENEPQTADESDADEEEEEEGEEGEGEGEGSEGAKNADNADAAVPAEEEENASSLPNDMPVEKNEGPKITLQSFENNMSFNDDRIHDNAPTLVTRLKDRRHADRPQSSHGEGSETAEEDEEDEFFVKDAYLVFRAMCRLSTKAIPVDHALDIRSQGMRSKLLSLHIIHTILTNNIGVFISPYATIRSNSGDEPTTFVQAIKQYLCLSLSRNGASSVSKVFEVSCEIFWLMLKYLRVMLKKEIEVFLKEIYIAILDKRAAPVFQKQYILTILSRLATDARALVEIYLNYDCDRTALDNMFQRLVEHLSRMSTTPIPITAVQQHAYQEYHAKHGSLTDWQTRGGLPPSLSTASMQAVQDVDHGFPQEYAMRQESLQVLIQILRSLVDWSQQGISETVASSRDADSRHSLDDRRISADLRDTASSPQLSGLDSGNQTPVAEDDPNQLERTKQKKTALLNAIRVFNYKPKRGIKLLLKEGFIKSDSPEDIARFFHENDMFDKKALGEFLGEGDPENVAIMHAFVDYLDFRKTRFVDALRRFLQGFRLPGEGQKIDRFMLKFAERYISGNPNAFANADTAYVLSYSVIMLNTDQHSSKIKKGRMTPEDFIKNNRGINDNADLPDEYLRGIYDEIARNEIVLDTERETAANLGLLPQTSTGLAANIGQALVGRDPVREAIVQASEEMANKTEQLYKNLLRAQRRGTSKIPISKFIPASSFKHVGPMFQVTWMPFLTALSGQAQDTQNLHTVKECMEGLKLAIHIACIFDLEDPRQAFVSSLTKFTNLYNLSEMKAKNVEALRVMLEVAHTEGNYLKESWRDILTTISQLDRFQLISTGVDATVVPDVLKAHTQSSSRQGSLAVPKGRSRSRGGSVQFESEIAEDARSTEIIRNVDRIFTNTANLTGEAIVYFVKALTQVSWQEIQSSGQSESPRTYSLQKIVEISGYNMTRVRFEWTSIWQVLGEHFNQVGCHNNTNVVFFAINSLRQLSMRFMEIEELPGFKFQKDFMKPFEHIIANSAVVTVKDMVLRCLIQMIQARGDNIRSGWKTMFGVFRVAAGEAFEGIVRLAFENVTQVYNERFGVVISQGAFADLIVCLTEFSKNHRFQKISLQAIETLKSSVPKMLRTPECPLSARAGFLKEPQSSLPKQPSRQTEEEQFWFPVLFAYHDVLMTGEDLEVRSRALSYLFETLIKYGGDFPQDFWDTLWRQLLFPIFMVLRDRSELKRDIEKNEELQVWLSTTMIQALRHMITLFTHFFEALEYMIDRFLDLLALCICQENDTLARIGSNCLQQLILQNVTKFKPEHWNKIVNAFVDLFKRTEATALFSAATSAAYTPSLNGRKNSKAAGSSASRSSSVVTADLPLNNGSAAEGTGDENGLGINGVPIVDQQTEEITANRLSSTTPEPTPVHNQRRGTVELEDYRPESELQRAPVEVTAARRKFFNQIITKCVLQLLMIETVQELFTNDAVYQQIPSPELLQLMAVLKRSYHFAKRFNADRELRARLFREGFMKQPPNLLKQESGSASVYVSILFRMYHDKSTERASNRAETEAALIPLCTDIVASYIRLDEETQQRNIITWRPVVVNVLEGYTGFPAQEFETHVDVFAPLAVGLLGTEMAPELQKAVQALVARIFETKLGMDAVELMPTPTSPRSGYGSRRASKVSR